MSFTVRKATKTSARLRLALIGPSGSGKTYSALSIATALKGPVAVIDTERGSASKYADLFTFDVLELESFAPDTYVAALEHLRGGGYTTVIVDSLSHAWMGKDGALEQKERAEKRGGNSWTAWRDVTPMYTRLVEAIITYPAHVIATVRAKTEYVQEKDERGRTTIRKVGMAPVQRDGLEYEFDVVGDMTLDNEMLVSKTRCPSMAGKSYPKPGANVAAVLSAWLSDGAPAPMAPPRPVSEPPPAERDMQARRDEDERHHAQHRERRAAEELLFASLLADIQTSVDFDALDKAKSKMKAAKLQLSVAHWTELLDFGMQRRGALEAAAKAQAEADAKVDTEQQLQDMGPLPEAWGGETVPLGSPEPADSPPPADVQLPDFGNEPHFDPKSPMWQEKAMSAVAALHMGKVRDAKTLAAYRRANSAFIGAAAALTKAEQDAIWAVCEAREKEFATPPAPASPQQPVPERP